MFPIALFVDHDAMMFHRKLQRAGNSLHQSGNQAEPGIANRLSLERLENMS
jgi:hypothetical protein